MAVPKKKISRSRRGGRRAHQGLTVKSRGTCPRCGREKLPHRACAHCGFYKGKEIIVPQS
ncbi:MAG: 50S ribosomal protein L32 [Planctomycetes bacterium]|nr:50S ribosomal protein L32 [Planctomycetota bacterium]